MTTERRKHIAFVTWLGDGNFGTTLQAYALFTTFKKLGYAATYVWPFDLSWGSRLRRIPRRAVQIALGLFGLHPHRRSSPHPPPSPPLKAAKLNRFLAEEIPQIHIRSRKNLHTLLDTTDAFCVGTDQLWNTYYSKDTFMLLPWAENKKRISYATSIGTKDIAPDMRATYRQALLKFDHLSLREESGRSAVAQLTGRTDIETVLDPTLLLSPEDWRSVARHAEFEAPLPAIPSKPFALCYLIGKVPSYAAQLAEVVRQTGLHRIIQLPSREAPAFSLPGALVYEAAAVREFVSLLDAASLVITDSFHATTLSILLEKPFVEFLRFQDHAPGGQNSRIHDLLSVFHLQNRLYAQDSVAWAEPLDYSPAASLLASARADSLAYLVNAIEA